MVESNDAIQGDQQPLLVAERLGKSYGRQVACRDVSFALYPGEVLAIVGESGSGKTTLLQLLSAQLAPSAGICARTPNAVRSHFSTGECVATRTDESGVEAEQAFGSEGGSSSGPGSRAWS